MAYPTKTNNGEPVADLTPKKKRRTNKWPLILFALFIIALIAALVKSVLTKRETKDDTWLEIYKDNPKNRTVNTVSATTTPRSNNPSQKSQHDDGELLSPTHTMGLTNPLSPLNPANTWDGDCTDSRTDTASAFSRDSCPSSFD